MTTRTTDTLEPTNVARAQGVRRIVWTNVSISCHVSPIAWLTLYLGHIKPNPRVFSCSFSCVWLLSWLWCVYQSCWLSYALSTQWALVAILTCGWGHVVRMVKIVRAGEQNYGVWYFHGILYGTQEESCKRSVSRTAVDSSFRDPWLSKENILMMQPILY